MRKLSKWIKKKNTLVKTKKKNWKNYKRFFLFKQKINMWQKFKYYFSHILIFKKYYTHDQILKRTSIIKSYYEYVYKKSFNKIYLFFHKLYFRINLILTYSHFVFNKFEGLSLIKNGLVTINNKIITNCNHTIKIQDLLYLFLTFLLLKTSYKYKLRKIIRKIRKYHINRFKMKYFNRYLLKNFFEISYIIRSLVCIKVLRNVDLIKKKRKFLAKTKQNQIKSYNILNIKLIKKFWSFN